VRSIRFVNVSYTYNRVEDALKQISLNIGQNEVVGIMGRNGAGKSTLIQLMNGLLYPSDGEVLVDGIATTEYNPSELIKKIGIMFQNPDHQLFSTTVEEELDFSLRNLKLPATQKIAYKQEIIEELGLQNLLTKSPWNCSGGERKKTSIASILCRKPEVLVFDEPTLGQDKYGYQILDNVLSQAIEKKKTIVVVTHNTEFAYKHLKRIIVMEQGRILADGPTHEILSNSALRNLSSLVEPQFLTFKQQIIERLSAQNPVLSLIQQSQNFEILQKNLLTFSRRERNN
jgi:energy-coupling factor transporter ATP-binding protein EcfA2